MSAQTQRVAIGLIAILIILGSGWQIMGHLRGPRFAIATSRPPDVGWANIEAEGRFQPRVVIPTRFPVITEFELRRGDQLGDELNPAELVLGIELNGEARAYPINMLTGPQREIINDRLGNVPIAATW